MTAPKGERAGFRGVTTFGYLPTDPSAPAYRNFIGWLIMAIHDGNGSDVAGRLFEMEIARA